MRSGTPVRVFVVDDAETVRDSLREVLQDVEGFEWAGEAVSGEGVLEDIAMARPDVVLMDVRMPGLDGIEVTRLIRREHPGVAVLMHSAYDEPEYQRSALSAGASGYVVKGTGISHLTRMVRAAARDMRTARAAVSDGARSART